MAGNEKDTLESAIDSIFKHGKDFVGNNQDVLDLLLTAMDAGARRDAALAASANDKRSSKDAFPAPQPDHNQERKQR